MVNAGKIGRTSTTGSAVALTAIVLAVIFFACMLIYFINNTDMLENIVGIVIIIIFAIIIMAIVFGVVLMILAPFFYAAKGETYQTNISYKLDDIRSVKEKDSEKENDPVDDPYKGS